MPAIDSLFDTLIAKKGSDLHMAVGRPPNIRARGKLVDAVPEAISDLEMQKLLLEILTPVQKTKLESEWDLDFAYAYVGKARFRASYFYRASPSKRGIPELGAVFRVIPERVLSLEELGCPVSIRNLAEKKAGLMLVTGPTGSGKSTTLAAMINHINRLRSCHILTIEDPVEFVHQGNKSLVTQREIGTHASDFASAIRSAGREDAEVILVGELRTNETMKLALQLASFGILIFGTVHTNGAAETVDRVLGTFPADEQPMVRGLLAESLIGIVSQQLLPTADGVGRVAAHEILVGSSALSSMIRDGRTYQVPSLMQAGQSVGMQTMDMALMKLLKDRKITREVAMERATDRELFQERS